MNTRQLRRIEREYQQYSEHLYKELVKERRKRMILERMVQESEGNRQFIVL